MSITDGDYLNALYEEYSSLLTDNRKDIFECYYRLDLSLGEIAELKGVSRQSVCDSLAASKKQLLFLEENLRLYEKKNAVYRLIDRLSAENKAVGEEIKKTLG